MIARYSCNPGYLLMEALALRLCTISGQWSGTAPTCERMSYMMPYLDSIMDTIYIACKVICCLLLLSPIPYLLLKQLTVVPYQIHWTVWWTSVAGLHLAHKPCTAAWQATSWKETQPGCVQPLGNGVQKYPIAHVNDWHVYGDNSWFCICMVYKIMEWFFYQITSPKSSLLSDSLPHKPAWFYHKKREGTSSFTTALPLTLTAAHYSHIQFVCRGTHNLFILPNTPIANRSPPTPAITKPAKKISKLLLHHPHMYWAAHT